MERLEDRLNLALFDNDDDNVVWATLRFDEVDSYVALNGHERTILHQMNRWGADYREITMPQYRPMPLPVPPARPPPEPVQVEKKSMPKHIADQIWELNEPDCQICLDKIKKDEYKLSPCGHHFCSRCFKDTRVDRCGECRQELTLA